MRGLEHGMGGAGGLDRGERGDWRATPLTHSPGGTISADLTRAEDAAEVDEDDDDDDDDTTAATAVVAKPFSHLEGRKVPKDSGLGGITGLTT